MEMSKFYCYKEVLCNSYQSRNLIGPYHFCGIAHEIHVSSPDRFLLGGAHGLGMRLGETWH